MHVVGFVVLDSNFRFKHNRTCIQIILSLGGKRSYLWFSSLNNRVLNFTGQEVFTLLPSLPFAHCHSLLPLAPLTHFHTAVVTHRKTLFFLITNRFESFALCYLGIFYWIFRRVNSGFFTSVISLPGLILDLELRVLELVFKFRHADANCEQFILKFGLLLNCKIDFGFQIWPGHNEILHKVTVRFCVGVLADDLMQVRKFC